MVEAIIDAVEKLSVEAKTEVAECQMVDITKDSKHVEETASDP